MASTAIETSPGVTWGPAWACCFGIAVSYPVILPTATALLVFPLQTEYGWSPSSTLLALLLVVLVGMFSGPATGALADRFGPLRVALICLVAQALVFMSFCVLHGDIRYFYARYILLALFAAGANSSAYMKILRSAYSGRRGTAIGIAFAGTGIGGVAWSMLAATAFSTLGFRTAFALLGVFILLVAIPTLGLALRGVPPEDEEASAGRPPGHDTGPQGVSPRLLGILCTFCFMAAAGIYAVQVNIPRLLLDAGSTSPAAHVLATLWACFVVGRLLCGYLLDRIETPKLARAFTAIAACGLVAFAWPGAAGPFVAAALLGLGAGGEIDTVAYLTAREVAARHHATVFGLCFATFGLGAGVGPYAFSLVRDHAGDGTPALGLALVFLVFAGLLTSAFPRRPRPGF